MTFPLGSKLIQQIGINHVDSSSIEEISQAVRHHCELKRFQKNTPSGNSPCFSCPTPAAQSHGLMLSLIGGWCEGSGLASHQKGTYFFGSFLWPCGVAEQCSRHRRQGAHCLSTASLCAAGVGEPRREPEGPRHGHHGFGSFCRNKKPVLSPAEGDLGCRADPRQENSFKPTTTFL